MEKEYYENETFESLKLIGEEFADYRFSDCTFLNCEFEDISLFGCVFSGCAFKNCLVTRLKATGCSQIKYCEFTDCGLTGINWSTLLPEGRFADPIEKFQNCRLKYCTFMGINFRKFSFAGNDIYDSMFAECPLAESKFKACKLERTEFFKCDLQKSDFRDAVGYQIDITSCKVKNARFSYPEVVNLLGALGVKIEYPVNQH